MSKKHHRHKRNIQQPPVAPNPVITNVAAPTLHPKKTRWVLFALFIIPAIEAAIIMIWHFTAACIAVYHRLGWCQPDHRGLRDILQHPWRIMQYPERFGDISPPWGLVIMLATYCVLIIIVVVQIQKENNATSN